MDVTFFQLPARGKMKRMLFNLTTCVSLFVCIAAMLLWFLTSLGWGHFGVFQGPYTSYVVAFVEGDVSFQRARISPDPERPETFRWRFFGGNARDYAFDPQNNFSRIPYSDGLVTAGPPTTIGMSMDADCRGIVIPLWLVACAAAIPPLKGTVRRWRQRTSRLRIEQGQCSRCGYDLRSSPLRCPECGAVPGAGESAAV